MTTVDDDLRHCRHATVSVGASCPSLHVRWIFVSLPNIRGGRPTFLLLTTIYHSDINETVRFHCDVRNRWSRALSACKVMCSCTTYLVLQRVDRAHFSFAARNFPSLFGPIARSTTRTRRSGRDGTPGSTRRGPMRRPQRARRRRGVGASRPSAASAPPIPHSRQDRCIAHYERNSNSDRSVQEGRLGAIRTERGGDATAQV